MKSSLLLLLLLPLFLGLPKSSFSKADLLFEIDVPGFKSDFTELDALESFLIQSPVKYTYSELSQLDEDLLKGVSDPNLSYGIVEIQAFDPSDLDWGAFAWGLCCAPFGFFTVAIAREKDAYQKSSYWIGVGVNVIVVGGLVIVNAVASSL